MNEEKNEGVLKHGCVKDSIDARDYKLSEKVGISKPFDWSVGYDVEKDLKIDIPIKDQDQSSSCVGQGNSYLAGVVNASMTGIYDEVSAKAIYSQIFMEGGGANIRDGIALTTTFGEVLENIVDSHKNDGSVDESFMEDKTWITPEIIKMAKNLKTKSYARVTDTTMEGWAMAIRDNKGVVAGVEGTNNGTWMSNEPKVPSMNTLQQDLWGHCLFFGKAGTDKLGKYISTPNSWNVRKSDDIHPDGWQKLRQEWFNNQGRFLFNAWTLIDNINLNTNNMTFKKEKNVPNIYACNDITKVKCLMIDMPTLQAMYDLTGVDTFTEVDSLEGYMDCSMKTLIGIDRIIN